MEERAELQAHERTLVLYPESNIRQIRVRMVRSGKLHVDEDSRQRTLGV